MDSNRILPPPQLRFESEIQGCTFLTDDLPLFSLDELDRLQDEVEAVITSLNSQLERPNSNEVWLDRAGMKLRKVCAFQSAIKRERHTRMMKLDEEALQLLKETPNEISDLKMAAYTGKFLQMLRAEYGTDVINDLWQEAKITARKSNSQVLHVKLCLKKASAE